MKKELWYLGENLRNQLNADIKTVLSLSHKDELMADLPWIADSIALRNVYTDPLNLLQVECSVVSVNCLKTQALMSSKP